MNALINTELKIGNEICNIIVLYRSTSPSQDELEKFSEKLKFGKFSPKNPFLWY